MQVSKVITLAVVEEILTGIRYSPAVMEEIMTNGGCSLHSSHVLPEGPLSPLRHPDHH